jgi:hypothetical protein
VEQDIQKERKTEKGYIVLSLLISRSSGPTLMLN